MMNLHIAVAVLILFMMAGCVSLSKGEQQFRTPEDKKQVAEAQQLGEEMRLWYHEDNLQNAADS